MQNTISENIQLPHSNNPYCTTEDILRYRKSFEKDGVNHVKGKYEVPDDFSKGPITPYKIPSSEQNSPSKHDIIRVSGTFDSTQTSPTHSGTVGPANFSEGVTEDDILQVDMFFKSHKTDVNVCSCLANLYFGKAMGGKDHWKFSTTGIPVLVLDSGEHHRKRKLQIVLAEKGTGFVLWKNTIDHLTRYEAPHDNFHTLHLSTDHTKLAGLSFDDSGAAKDFLKALTKYTSNPDDELFQISNKGKKKKKPEKKKLKYKSPNKAEISQPCCFVHVTKLDTTLDKSDCGSHGEGSSSSRSCESGMLQTEYVTDPSLSDMVGSKLTLNSESASSGISEH